MDGPATALPAQMQAVILHRLALASYFSVGSLSVFIFDVLVNLGHDYDLVKTHGVDLASAVYFTSRLSTLGFLLSVVFILVQPMDECNSVRVIFILCYILFVASTLLLSFIRVSAVWNRCSRVVIVFGFLWLCAVAGSFTVIKGIGILKIEGLCLETVFHPYVSAAVILPTANHVLVFIAITVGLCKCHSTSIFDFGKGVRLYIFGETLPAFSKALLQSSQLCYVIAIIAGAAALIWFYVCDFDESYRLAMVPPYAAVVNIMFSWVFRKAKLGIFTVIPHSATIEHSNVNSIGLRQTRHAPFPFEPTKNNDMHSFSPSRMSSFHTSDDHGVAEIHLTRTYSLEEGAPVKIEVEQVVEYRTDLGAAEKGM
ncbi:hypothetical protein D9613_009389 [Agrocybe pediades]|uniref:Uncharacterized protein n=1 Tax=Agrocybe pediades TaxID=84607 RepID=A0A8H4VTJ8_9AGAR|nr:hypothetical protein D9613_009389 [Agrocybe pediades]